MKVPLPTSNHTRDAFSWTYSLSCRLCEKTYSDHDAICGVQRAKANQNKLFIGYRKHSIVCPSPKGSLIPPNDTADVKLMLPPIEIMKKSKDSRSIIWWPIWVISIPMIKKEARLKHDVAGVTEIRKHDIS